MTVIAVEDLTTSIDTAFADLALADQAAVDSTTVAADATTFPDMVPPADQLIVIAPDLVVPARDLVSLPSCFNMSRDGDETDVDCGGSCLPCAGGLSCLVDADCRSGACAGNTCLRAISFTAAPYASDHGTVAVALGDFNNDSRLDIAAVNRDGNSLSILTNQATMLGTFTTKSFPINAGSTPVTLAVGDAYVANGTLDVFVGLNINPPANLNLFRGDGTGNMSPTIPAGNSQGKAPRSVLLTDVNGDGINDFIVANESNNVVYVEIGGITIGMPVYYPVGAGPTHLAAADLTGDGLPELLVVNSVGNSLNVLVNNAGNKAGAFTTLTFNLGGCTAPRAVAVGSFNATPFFDVAIACAGAGAVVLLHDFTANAFSANSNIFVGGSPNFVTLADLNGDGRSDLAVAIGGTNQVLPLVGKNDGIFRPQPPVTVNQPVYLAAGNLDGNALNDVAVARDASATTSNVVVLLNTSK
jgi:hypothetical protein